MHNIRASLEARLRAQHAGVEARPRSSGDAVQRPARRGSALRLVLPSGEPVGVDININACHSVGDLRVVVAAVRQVPAARIRLIHGVTELEDARELALIDSGDITVVADWWYPQGKPYVHDGKDVLEFRPLEMRPFDPYRTGLPDIVKDAVEDAEEDECIRSVYVSDPKLGINVYWGADSEIVYVDGTVSKCSTTVARQLISSFGFVVSPKVAVPKEHPRTEELARQVNRWLVTLWEA